MRLTHIIYDNLSSKQTGYNAAVRISLITKKPYNIQNRFWKNVEKRVLSIILVQFNHNNLFKKLNDYNNSCLKKSKLKS